MTEKHTMNEIDTKPTYIPNDINRILIDVRYGYADANYYLQEALYALENIQEYANPHQVLAWVELVFNNLN